MKDLELTRQALSQARENAEETIAAINNINIKLGQISARAVRTETATALEEKTRALRTVLETYLAAMDSEINDLLEVYEY